MEKIQLPKVTLVAVSDVNIPQTIKAIEKCLAVAEFADVLFFTSVAKNYLHAIECRPINSIQDYNKFIIKELPDRIETDFVLIIHADGFIVNPNSWSNVFLSYDYCGAPWSSNIIGGNGGFSLRSKRLLDLSKELIENVNSNEDLLICTTHGMEMIARGIKFAPYDINLLFSSEKIKNPKSFGFHNLNLNPEYRD